jgi:hypothetical protein
VKWWRLGKSWGNQDWLRALILACKQAYIFRMQLMEPGLSNFRSCPLAFYPEEWGNAGEIMWFTGYGLSGLRHSWQETYSSHGLSTLLSMNWVLFVLQICNRIHSLPGKTGLLTTASFTTWALWCLNILGYPCQMLFLSMITSDGILSTRCCDRVAQNSLSCDYSLFSSPQIILVYNNRPDLSIAPCYNCLR